MLPARREERRLRGGRSLPLVMGRPSLEGAKREGGRSGAGFVHEHRSPARWSQEKGEGVLLGNALLRGRRDQG